MTQLTQNIYAFDLGATLIGVLMGADGATLIDSGMNKSHCKKIEKELDRPVVSILHTHYHADHIGGTAYFCSKDAAKAYMPSKEISLAACTELNPALVYGGKAPLCYTKPFFKAEAFDAQVLPDTTFMENGFNISAVETPGHSIGHTGYIVDGVFFAGDALTSPSVIEKHGLLYIFDPQAAYNTLESMKKLDFNTTVLCHKGLISKAEFISYADGHKTHIEMVEREVYGAVLDNTADNITRLVMRKLDMTQTAESFLLTGSSIKGYLAKLEAEKRVHTEFNETEGLIWSRN